jgi:hypothetical protein
MAPVKSTKGGIMKRLKPRKNDGFHQIWANQYLMANDGKLKMVDQFDNGTSWYIMVYNGEY